jgi:hypothetical protein
MTEERERDLMGKVLTLGCVAEAEGFHAQIKAQGEQITTALLAALLARIRLLRDREARG